MLRRKRTVFRSILEDRRLKCYFGQKHDRSWKPWPIMVFHPESFCLETWPVTAGAWPIMPPNHIVFILIFKHDRSWKPWPIMVFCPERFCLRPWPVMETMTDHAFSSFSWPVMVLDQNEGRQWESMIGHASSLDRSWSKAKALWTENHDRSWFPWPVMLLAKFTLYSSIAQNWSFNGSFLSRASSINWKAK